MRRWSRPYIIKCSHSYSTPGKVSIRLAEYQSICWWMLERVVTFTGNTRARILTAAS